MSLDIGKGGGKILDLDSPVTLEAGKKYQISETIKVGKPEKGIITRIFFMDRKVFDCFGDWHILNDYETGLKNQKRLSF